MDRPHFLGHWLSLLLLLPACAPGPAPLVGLEQVEETGLLEQNPLIQGRDGGYSALVFSRSVWLYGDTILAEPAADGRQWRHNSWSYTGDLYAEDGITDFEERQDDAGLPAEFFPQTPTEKAFNDIHFVDDCTEEPCGARWALWPAVLVADPERERALAFYHKIYAEPGDFNFEGVGSSVATWESLLLPLVRPQFNISDEHPTLLWPRPAPSFGSAALVVDGVLFLYGCQTEGWDKPCYLARVSLAQATNAEAWMYWHGDGDWHSTWQGAKPVFDGNDMMSTFWSDAVGAYVAIYSQPMDRKVMMRSAMSPSGPWSKATTLFTAEKPEGSDWVYDALAHPEYARDDGRIQLVTYSRATGFLQSEIRTVEVTLTPIDR